MFSASITETHIHDHVLLFGS